MVVPAFVDCYWRSEWYQPTINFLYQVIVYNINRLIRPPDIVVGGLRFVLQLLSPNADTHGGDYIVYCFFLFVRRIFGNGYLGRG